MPSGDKWAVLFDLDETLVLSAALESLRRAGDWPKVYAAFGMTTLPPGTIDAHLGRRHEVTPNLC